ncbi:DUF6338 family protein [Nisaea sp.]|uniref:DUF6338 family protein n=1 Tax=Nisaea sp. TaxID=2024842 RepID=UPI003B52EED3
MPKIDSIESVYFALGFLVPGLIVLFVRAQFVTGQRASSSLVALDYLTISVAYYALTLPIVDAVTTIQEPGYGKAFAWFSLVFIGPAILGLLLGINVQKNYIYRLLRKIGLNPVHVVPSAWDWKFGNMQDQWVLVALKDGTKFGGFCGNASFISSQPTERDIFIQWIYDINDSNEWIPRGETGALIPAGEILSIEFWPYVPEENENEQQ